MKVDASTVASIVPLFFIGWLHRWIARKGAFLLVVSTLPVSFVHESSHYVVSLLLGGRPSGINLWPTVDNNGRWILGSVTFRPTFLSALPSALAPLLLLPVGLYLFSMKEVLALGTIEGICLVYLAAYVCLAASIPSWQDIKVAVTHPVSVMCWVAIWWGASTFLG